MGGRASLLSGLLLLIGAASPLMAADPVLDGLRHRDEERREEALRELLSAPGAVTERVAASRLVEALGRIHRGDRDPLLRGLAAWAIGRIGDTEERLQVLESLAAEDHWLARDGVLRGLDGVTDPEVVGRAIERSYRGEAPARARFALALGRLEGDRARSALLGLEQAEGAWPVRAAIFLGLARQPSVEAVERCLAGLDEGDPAVVSAAREALTRLTGRSRAASTAAWRAWWEEERARFDPENPGDAGDGEGEGEPDAEVADAPDDPDRRYRAPDDSHLPRYYGIPIRGTRVAFCLDVSASMWGEKFEAATAELTTAVKALPSDVRFTVFFFNENVRPWPADPVPALPSTKLALFGRIRELEIKSYTNIHDALEHALGLAGRGRWARDPPPGVDDVFIVSDGEPNRGKYRDPNGILRSLERLNAPAATRIHGIAIGDVPQALMKAIADANGGTFVSVKPGR